ncbi:MAG: hypothetical protein K1060chlam2_01355 [Chlamydiae bacterium]|nr:hypothetical protein [Chlamydiota bacterium]
MNEELEFCQNWRPSLFFERAGEKYRLRFASIEAGPIRMDRVDGEGCKDWDANAGKTNYSFTMGI